MLTECPDLRDAIRDGRLAMEDRRIVSDRRDGERLRRMRGGMKRYLEEKHVGGNIRRMEQNHCGAPAQAGGVAT